MTGTVEELVHKLEEVERLTHAGTWEMDLRTGQASWSDNFYRICGLQPGEVEPTADEGLRRIHEDDRERAAQALEDAIGSLGDYEVEKRIVRPSGEIRYVISRGRIFCDEYKNPVRIAGAFIDITEQKEAQRRIQRMNDELERKVEERTTELKALSLTDELTRLNNRRGLMHLLGRALRTSQRRRTSLVLAYFDMDGLKPINDRHGHGEGDTALRAIGAALQRVIRSSDIVARIGGDEFVAVLEDLAPPQLTALCDRVNEVLERFVRLNSKPYRISVSAGWIEYDARRHYCAAELLREADKDMYTRRRLRQSAGRCIAARYGDSVPSGG